MQKNDTSTLKPIPFKVPEGVTASLPLTITPDFRYYILRFGLLRLLLVIGLFVFAFFRFGPEGGFWFLVGTVALMAIVLWRMFSRSFTVTENELIYRNGWGISRRLPLDQIGPVNFYSAYVDPTFGRIPRVLIGNKAGDHFVSLLGHFWTTQDMERLAYALQQKKLKVDLYEQILNWSMMAHFFPKLLTPADRHPIALALIILAVFLVVFTIGFIAINGFS